MQHESVCPLRFSVRGPLGDQPRAQPSAAKTLRTFNPEVCKPLGMEQNGMFFNTLFLLCF